MVTECPPPPLELSHSRAASAARTPRPRPDFGLAMIRMRTGPRVPPSYSWVVQLDAKNLLDLAARLALRGRGDVEPNPLVGAVIVKDGAIIGRGHHRKYGGLHAETEALADCRGRGADPRGATLYVTLEPCDHFGKQPPCTKAIVESGIVRVVIARSDPNPVSSGGAESLRRAGLDVEFTSASDLAIRISDPFVKRITTGLPWVIAKWAQTPDGRLTLPPTESRWISNELSRRRVHRLRSRVDVVLTGIGTVEADDPLLTTRDVPRIRRVARRVVLDTNLKLGYGTALVRTARTSPVLVLCDAANLARDNQARSKALVLASAHVAVQGIPRRGEHLDLRAALETLASQYQAANVLVEAGPRLLKSFLDQGLADELVVYVGAAPRTFEAPEHHGFQVWRTRRLGDDVELRYRRSS
jgi:diaminohydroxyphosphoribosylaminopyrimidine deaminase / 5-amino-6-(5-phosphoribosylamino)uracil reductase